MKKNGNKTVRASKPARGKASKPSLRLQTAVALGPLHPLPEPPSPPSEPCLTTVPEADNLTEAYKKMLDVPCPPEHCAAAGVPEGSTIGQVLVARHVMAAVSGDGTAATHIVNRLEGRTPDGDISEAVFLRFLDRELKGPNAERLSAAIYQRIALPPRVEVNFAGPNACSRCGYTLKENAAVRV